MTSALVVLSLLLAVVPDPAALRRQVRAWREAHAASVVRELAALLELPNVASDLDQMRRNARLIGVMLERRGLQMQLLEAEGAPPVVFAELKAPGARKTIVVYAHYDGQPVMPSQWTSDPWKPVLRDGPLPLGKEVRLDALPSQLDGEWRLYARSAGDDKAPIVGVLAALDALRAIGGTPSVNLKLFLDGEEEAGSPHLRAILERHRERLAADAWLFCDGPVHQSRRMQLFFGVRGVVTLEMTVYGPAQALHSGHYGNWAPNPALRLARLLAELRDADGRIRIDAFGDDVRPPTDTERAALATVPDVEASLRDSLALGETEAGPIAAGILRPALNVRGLRAGEVGERAANAVPTEATASIDFRLVPEQTPEKVRERLEAHLAARDWHVVHQTPDLATRRAHARVVKLEWGAGYPAYRAALDAPLSKAVSRVVEESLGSPIVLMPTLGGSLPIHVFHEVLSVPLVGLPIANHDDNQHAADENLRLQNLWDGIEVYAGLLARLGPALE